MQVSYFLQFTGFINIVYLCYVKAKHLQQMTR
jgi:hypothetical protein